MQLPPKTAEATLLTGGKRTNPSDTPPVGDKQQYVSPAENNGRLDTSAYVEPDGTSAGKAMITPAPGQRHQAYALNHARRHAHVHAQDK